MGELQPVYDRIWIYCVKTTDRLLGAPQQHYSKVIQLVVNVSIASMATMSHYSTYVALLRTSVEGPGFADVATVLRLTISIFIFLIIFQWQHRSESLHGVVTVTMELLAVPLWDRTG
jgi:hypothetical protein